MRLRRAVKTGYVRVNVKISWSQYQGSVIEAKIKFPISLLNNLQEDANVERLCEFLFLIEAKNINGATVVTAHPGFEDIIIFKNIHANRVSGAWEGNDTVKTFIVDPEDFDRIAAVTRHK